MEGRFVRRSVASLRQRLVYKTEFDIFKQNSDLDLISLISYDEDISDSELNFEEADHSGAKTVEKNVDKTNTYIKVKDKSNGHSNVKRITLIERQNRENYNNKRNRLNERTCKSAVSFKGYDSRGSANIERSQTAFGSRTVTYNRNSRCNPSCLKGNEHERSSVCLRYRSCNSARQSTPRQTTNRYVRSKSAHGHTSCLSVPQQDTTPRVKSSTGSVNPSPTNRPIIVVGKKDNLSKRVDTDTVTKKIRVSQFPETNDIENVSNADETCSNDAIQDSELVKDKNRHRLKSDTNRFISTHDSDSLDSVKNEECLNSKDSGYHGSESSPDLTRTIGCPIQTPSKLSNVLHPETDTPGVEVKKHVTFSVENDLDSDTSNIPDVDSLSITADDVVSDLEENGSVGDDTNLPTYSLDSLLIGLEQSDYQTKTSSSKSDLESCGASENNSIFDENTHQADDSVNDIEQEGERVVDIDFDKEKDTSEHCKLVKDTTTMSREARFAIIETLQDMRGNRSASKAYSYRNKESASASTLHKSIGQQRRLRDNRNKYDQYVRERTNTTLSRTNQTNPYRPRLNGSVYSSDTESGDCDESDSNDEPVKPNRFPAIGLSASQFKEKPSTKTKVLNLDQVKRKKYKIPGIGNYELVMSPEAEFEITPPGFDSRYNHGPAISKEELETPPQLIRERSIIKCKKWLKNVNLSPLSLNPVLKRNDSST